MLNFIYILFTLSVINVIIYLFKMRSFSNVHLGLLFIFNCICIWGDLSIAISKTLSEAILAKKIAYLGAVCVIACAFFTVLQVCNYRVRRRVRLPIYIMVMLQLMSVSTMGYNNFYYKKLELKYDNGIAYLDREGGIGHTLYYIGILAFFIAIIVVIIRTIATKRKVSFKNIMLIVTLVTITIVTFFGSRFLDLNMEIMPIAYVIDEYILLYISHRMNLYDVEGNVLENMASENNYGYIILDRKLKYIGSNVVANNIFKEMEELRIDFPLVYKETYIFNDITKWIEELMQNENSDSIVKTYIRDNRKYQCVVKKMYQYKKIYGFIIEIMDDTDRLAYLELLNDYNSELIEEVEEKTSHIMEMQDKILLSIGNMVENRDDNTGGHIHRTSKAVSLLIEEIKKDNIFKKSDGFYKAIVKTAPLHDLGKITIDDIILRKPGKLTDEEYEIMKTHSARGGEIVENILENMEDERIINIAKNIARYHHEKWDGKGYPDGLSGTDIPLEARIMAVADVYDALVSERCYKPKMSFEQANEVILSSMGTHFDPNLQVYYERAREKLEEYYKEV